MQNDSEENTATFLENFSDFVKKSNSEQITTTLHAKAVEEITTIEIDKNSKKIMYCFIVLKK